MYIFHIPFILTCFCLWFLKLLGSGSLDVKQENNVGRADAGNDELVKLKIPKSEEETEEEIRKLAIERHAKYTLLKSKLKYNVPPQAAPFDSRYSFEVLKNGLIVDQINFMADRTFYVIGRNSQ